MTISIAKSFALASLTASNIQVSLATSAGVKTSVNPEIEVPLSFDASGAYVDVRVNHGDITKMKVASNPFHGVYALGLEKETISFTEESSGRDLLDVHDNLVLKSLEYSPSLPWLLVYSAKSAIVQKVGAVSIIRNQVSPNMGKLVLRSSQESFEASCVPGSISTRREKDHGSHPVSITLKNKDYPKDKEPTLSFKMTVKNDFNYAVGDQIADMPEWVIKSIFLKLEEYGAMASQTTPPPPPRREGVRRLILPVSPDFGPNPLANVRTQTFSWAHYHILHQLPEMLNCDAAIVAQLPRIQLQFRDSSGFLEMGPEEYIRIDAEARSCRVLLRHSLEPELNIWRIPSLNMRITKNGIEHFCRAVSSGPAVLAAGAGHAIAESPTYSSVESLAGEGVSVAAGPGCPSTTTVLPSEEENTTLLA
jgi:hypothetical protein